MHALFSYGTLVEAAVQIATFGRRVRARPDALSGFDRTSVQIRDPEVVKATGLTHYENIVRTENPGHMIRGVVLEVTTAELESADQYEAGAAYRRIRVTLDSGTEAWVYLHESGID